MDTESEQIRDVYAHFGLAVYWGQCVEQSIFQYLVTFDYFPKAIKNFTTSEDWANNFDVYEAYEMSQTMGKLIGRLKKIGQHTSKIELTLSNALKTRNWLAHSYFSDRAVDFTMMNGRVDMIEELTKIKVQFQNCDKELEAITRPTMLKYGLNDDILAKIELDLKANFSKQKPKV